MRQAKELTARHAKTELLLYELLWCVDLMLNPTFSNLNSSFESWASRRGFLQQIHRLEHRGWLESIHPPFKEKPFLRLTRAGRRAILGGRDPEELWNADWDGVWRIFLFDVPVSHNRIRRDFTRVLRQNHCGCLQGSVWISHQLHPKVDHLFSKRTENPAFLLTIQHSIADRETNRSLALSAWPFHKINRRYESLRSVLNQFPADCLDPSRLREWAIEETKAWKAVMDIDPLLPKALLPSNYLGREVWKLRQKRFHQAAQLLQNLNRDTPTSA